MPAACSPVQPARSDRNQVALEMLLLLILPFFLACFFSLLSQELDSFFTPPLRVRVCVREREFKLDLIAADLS